MNKIKEIVPSLLSFEKQKWPQYFNWFYQNGINYIHFDVMDGQYVIQQAYDEKDFLIFINDKNNLKAHVHLMVMNPINEINKYIYSKTDAICFHFDACKEDFEVFDCLHLIKYHGIKPGIAINPNFVFKDYERFLDSCEFVTIMGVYPGKGGQKFELSCLYNLKDIANYTMKKQRNILIEIDGGMNFDTIPLVIENGEFFVSGSFLRNEIKNIKNIMDWFKKQCDNK